MLGISTSLFDGASGLLKGWLKSPFNAAFFTWYFLPAAGFALAQAVILHLALGTPLPAFLDVKADPPEDLSALVLQVLSARSIVLVVGPLALGLVLAWAAGMILRLYRGMLPATRPLFARCLARNQRRSAELYGPLQTLRREYFHLVAQGALPGAAAPPAERGAELDRLKREIQALHEQAESVAPVRELPVAAERIGPSALGNVLAVAEEYPFERYGLDAAVFWPRLRSELEPEKLEPLDASNLAMNGMLSISLLAHVLALELLIVAVAAASGGLGHASRLLGTASWLLAAALALLAGLGAYRAAVGAARSVGDGLRTLFDYERGRILRRFGLALPGDIDQERVVWLKLAAFLRRGESFYYPSDARGDSGG